MGFVAIHNLSQANFFDCHLENLICPRRFNNLSVIKMLPKLPFPMYSSFNPGGPVGHPEDHGDGGDEVRR